MHKHLKKHSYHIYYYFILALILLLGVTFFFFYNGNKPSQFIVIVITSMAYFLWGVVHHIVDNDLHPKIVVEYLLIALLAIFIIRGVLF
jgi:hypothetical protein